MNSVQDEEVIVGVHASGVELEEGLYTGGNNYCGKCRKHIHCHVKVEKGKASIIMTCSDTACVCKCRTHFACKRCGYLHPYGSKCTRVEVDTKTSKESNRIFKNLMEGWRKDKDV